MKVVVLLFFKLMAFNGQAQHNDDHNTNTSDEFSHHCFLPERSFSFGLGLPYSFNAEGVGINSRLYYNIGHSLCFGPEFSYFKTDELEIMDIDFIVHYIFETPITGIYPLAGVNYTLEEAHGHEEKAAGLVFGAGLHRNFYKLTLFAEYAHVQSDLADDFITLGFMFTFK